MIGKLTSVFGAVTVDGSTVKCLNQSLINSKVEGNDFVGIGGIRFEGESRIVPTELTVALLLDKASDTALTTIHNTITGQLNVKGTLTAQERGSGTSKTCTAKLLKVNDDALSPYTRAWAQVTLTFQCYTVWS